jgi:hypothetical protein
MCCSPGISNCGKRSSSCNWKTASVPTLCFPIIHCWHDDTCIAALAAFTVHYRDTPLLETEYWKLENSYCQHKPSSEEKEDLKAFSEG